MTINLSALQKQRRDTAANWTAENPTLLAGEIGLESDTGYWKVGDGATAWTSLAYVSGLGAEIPVDRLADGAARQLLQTDAAGTGVEWTDDVDVPGTLDVTGSATFDDDVTIEGDLTVNGTTTTIDTTTLVVEDKNIEIGKVATPTDVTADGGGITLKGTTDKTINWVDATDAWTLSEHVNIASGKEYRIDGTKVLDATSLGSSVLITSSNITDGTIVDGDINASAAIAGTKISPDFGSQTVQTTGIISHALGTATAPTVTFTGDTNTGIYSPGADQVAISTNGTQRLLIEADGDINIDSGGVFYDATNNRLAIGTTSPTNALTVKAANDDGIVLTRPTNASNAHLKISTTETGADQYTVTYNSSNNDQIFSTNFAGGSGGNIIFRTSTSSPAVEKVRIDSSGRLLVGTSSARSNINGTTPDFQLERVDGVARLAVLSGTTNTSAPVLFLAKHRGTAAGSNAAVIDGDNLGFIQFVGSDGTNFLQGASIATEVDGTPGSNDMPGRLVFSTTADGASSPTERMRIDSAGKVFVGKTSENFAVSGITLRPFGQLAATCVSDFPIEINRLTTDGGLVRFYQDGTEEGSISVSGTTVSYNGGHLARWSQLPNDEDPSAILKGTVLSNLDEMCEWGEEDNEQLNRMKVSDVEDDPNVAGVFVSTSFSDDGPLDFFCAMTGDMIIRIAEGVTVQRGDLLMSAGDGTAKPQDDDIIRSKTIAKVTSTNVTCTYDDGSYCVPCVLMAC